MLTDMPIIVQKYGGSSVATTEMIRRVADKVVKTKRAGNDVVVVVSAMANTTDELLDLAKQISSAPHPRELDMLVTVGERVSMSLLSMAICDLGEKAISFTGSQSGIITNDAAGAARIIGVRPYRVQDELARGNIVIVAGYQGVSYRLEVTTLGRGGSDTTAVALAAALSAHACEIYSDVDGIYSSDPRVVLDAERLLRVTYEEMQELARLGARVVNPDAVEFARRAGIALYCKATVGDGQGTTICRPDGFPDNLLAEERAGGVTGVAGRRDVIEVRATGPLAGQLPDLLSGREVVYSQLDLASETDTEPAGGRIYLTGENLHDLEGLRRQLNAHLAGAVEVTDDLGLVSAVGSRVGTRLDAAGRMLRALASAGLTVQRQWTHRLAVSAIVPAGEVDAGMRAVHAEFLE